MCITRKENKIKQEIILGICDIYNKENVELIYQEVKKCILSKEWEKIIIDFNKTKDIDLMAIKSLWDLKNISNSKQKALELIKINDRVAVALKFLGFEEKFCIKIDIDENIVNEVVMLGEYEEPLYEDKVIPNEIVLSGEKISLDSISNFVEGSNEKFNLAIKEWVVIPDIDRNKLIFLLEVKNAHDSEKVEGYLSDLILTKYNIESSVYILEKDSFEEYYNKKLKLGIPSKLVRLHKVVKNPYTKQYFLSKIDERY